LQRSPAADPPLLPVPALVVRLLLPMPALVLVPIPMLLPVLLPIPMLVPVLPLLLPLVLLPVRFLLGSLGTRRPSLALQNQSPAEVWGSP
jgi:hypothetical protein